MSASVIKSCHIPLSQAFLCQECECVVDNGSRCPFCGAHAHLISLAQMFGGSANIEISTEKQGVI
jgi:hypothetical protein